MRDAPRLTSLLFGAAMSVACANQDVRLRGPVGELAPTIVSGACDSGGRLRCDWVEAYRVAAESSGSGCAAELSGHWSMAVRSACHGVHLPFVVVQLGTELDHYPDVCAFEMSDQAEKDVFDAAVVDPPAFDVVVDGVHLREPVAALRLSNGWLVGADMGEWGGALVWMGDGSAEPFVVLDTPVHSIFAREGQVYVVATGAYRLTNLYSLEVVPGPAFQLTMLFRLPGRHVATWRDGDRVVLESPNGALVVSDDGIAPVCPLAERAQTAARPSQRASAQAGNTSL